MNFLGLFNIDNWIIILLLILAVTYWYMNSSFGIFEKIGLPGPKPYPFVGHSPYYKKGLENFDMEQVKKYGKIVGTYTGSMPVVLVADPEQIKTVFVKDVEYFTNRLAFDFGEEMFMKGVSALKGEQWKRTRSILTPTFSASKMKKMMPLINGSCKILTQNALECAKKGEKFEAKDLYGKFTMDVIAKTMFGLQIDCQTDEDNDFVKYAKSAFASFSGSPIFLIAVFLPKLMPLVKKLGFSIMDPKCVPFFVKSTQEVIEIRKQSSGKYHDFIQLMMNAHTDEEFIAQEGAKGDSKPGEDKVQKGLTDSEILGQALIFFLAGYETTASLLSWTTYSLAANPHVQDKLREEILDKLGDKEDISYDDVHEIPYLDMVINETLRHHPPVVRFDRVLSEPYELAGYKLPAGVDVQVPVYYMHHNEEWWPEPFEFRPERFSTEEKAGRSPYVFAPFGFGPRNCIGMRFALVEAKAALVDVLRKAKFTLPPDMPKKIIPMDDGYPLKKVGFHYPEKGLWIISEPVEN